MMRSLRGWMAARLLPAMAILAVAAALAGVPAAADVVIVESRTATGAVTPYPPYQEIGSWLNTAAKSTVPGLVAPGARFVTSGDGRGIKIKPTLAIPGGDYRVEITQNTGAGNVSQDLVVAISATGASGLPETTEAFRAPGSNTWKLVGDMKLDPGVTEPEITFTYLSGTVSGTSRWIFDAIRFTQIQPCLNTPPVTAVGPFDAGATTVRVTGISTDPAASLVTVYQIVNGVPSVIGTVDPQGQAAVDVPVSPLVRGTQVFATQTVNGQEGCLSSGGALVGSGPNPPVLVSLGIRETLTSGPVGADGGTSGPIEWLGPKEKLSGAPMGKLVIPSSQWQTITFDPLTDPVLNFNAGNNALDGAFGVLEHLAVAPARFGDGDPGSYKLYIDWVKNGDTVITDFESFDAGASVLLRQPSFSGTTSGNLRLPSPNEAVVDDTVSESGSKSLRVHFQFLDGAPARWVRLTTFNAANVPNPQVDLTQPISLRILLQPAPESGNLSLVGPANVTASDGDPAVFSVTALNASGPVHYQWYKNGLPILGSDSAMLTLPAVTMADNGAKIRATAFDGSRRVYSSEATLTVIVKPAPIGEVKSKVDGAQVKLKNPVVVTKSDSGGFWAQEQDRSSGIRVVSSQNPPVNTLVSNVEGVMATDPETGERYIDASGKTASIGSPFTPKPLGLTNRAAGGSRVTNGVGVPNDGLLVTVWGRVTGVDFSVPISFYLDDGSGVVNDTPTDFIPSPVPGVKVLVESFFPSIGDYCKVTGISRLARKDGRTFRVVEALSDMHIERVAP